MAYHPALTSRDLAQVYEWLGLGGLPPEGLQGRQRGRLTRRYTQEQDAGARSFGYALALAYDKQREPRLMQLLRPQRLDDALWRMIYAAMVKGAPIRQFSLVQSLALLCHTDTKVADAEAARLYRDWLLATQGQGDG